MAYPIEPTRPRVIRSTKDLRKETEMFHQSVSKIMEQTDQKIDETPDLEEWHREGGSLISRAFHEEEDILRKALIDFDKTLGSCKIAEDLPSTERNELEAHMKDLQGLLDGVKELLAKKFTKARARLLTKYIWGEIAFLKEVSLEVKKGQTDFIKTLKSKFDPNRLKWLIEVYRQTMDELDELSTQHEEGDDFAEMAIKKGRLLEVKEDLLLSFTEFKNLFSDKINLFYLATQEVRSIEDLKNKEILDRIQSGLRPERSTIEKVLEKTFTKKLVESPRAIAQMSLFLASTAKTIGSTAAKALGSTSGLLMSVFVLPVSAFSIYKMGHSFWRHREATREIKECKEIQKNAELMVQQGTVMQKNGQRVIQAAPSAEEVEFAQKILKQGTRLLTVGFELREKAHLNIEGLKNEQQRMKANVFIFGTLTASQLASGVGGIGIMLKDLVSSFATSGASTALHWVGIAGVGLGVVLASINLGIHFKGLYDDQKELALFARRSNSLDELNLKMPDQELLHNFTIVESHYHLVRAEELKISQRNHWISIASNAFLLVAGVLGIAAFIAAGVASGGLVFAVVGILLIGTVIATSHFFIKRSWFQNFDTQINRDHEQWQNFVFDLSRKIQWYGKEHVHMVELMKHLEIPVEKREAFLKSPEVFLKKRYQLILEGRT